MLKLTIKARPKGASLEMAVIVVDVANVTLDYLSVL